jgi:hypothetical protein
MGGQWVMRLWTWWLFQPQVARGRVRQRSFFAMLEWVAPRWGNTAQGFPRKRGPGFALDLFGSIL